jgi:triphosphatase
MSLEQEIKLAVNQDDEIELTHLTWLKPYIVSDVHQQHLVSDYYDTPQLDLIKSGVGLRLRNDNGEWMQTVKSSGRVVDGLHQRQEWEWRLEKAEFDLTLLKQTPLKMMIEDQHIWPKVINVFTTDFHRMAIQLKLGNNTEVELAYDRGRVYSDQKQTEIHEIELELKSGSIEEMTILAQLFCERLNVRPNESSKAKLGYELLG